MATTKTVLPDSNNLSRPFHALDLKEVYNSGDVAASGLSAGAVKPVVTTAVNDALEAFKAQWPFESEAAFDTAVDALKTEIQGDTDSAIDGLSGTDTTFHQILDTINADYQALAESDVVTNPPAGLSYVCPQCLGAGKNTGFNPDGTSDDTYVQSEICNGWGYTAQQMIRDPNSGFIVQP